MLHQTLDSPTVAPPDGGNSGALVPLTSPADEGLAQSARDNVRLLVSVCVDSLDALDDAIDLVDDSAVRQQLVQVSALRARTRDTLARFLRRQEAAADGRGTLAGAVHHWFNRVRIATSGKDPVVALIALESAEDRVRRNFLGALRTKMPLDAEEAIRSAFRQVLRCHDVVYALTRQAKAAA